MATVPHDPPRRETEKNPKKKIRMMRRLPMAVLLHDPPTQTLAIPSPRKHSKSSGTALRTVSSESAFYSCCFAFSAWQCAPPPKDTPLTCAQDVLLFLWFIRGNHERIFKTRRARRRGAKGMEITRAAVQKIGSTGQQGIIRTNMRCPRRGPLPRSMRKSQNTLRPGKKEKMTYR